MTHDDAWHALPFFINGTLRGQARSAVEAHLAACAECRSELAGQTQVHDAIVREDARQENAQVSFDKLWDRILEDEAVAEGRAAKVAAPPVAGVLRAPASGVMKWLVAAVIVEGIGLATLSAMTWSNSQGLSMRPDFKTVTNPQAPLAAARIRAVFSSDLQLGELQTLLATSRLSVVGGPTEAGVYTLALDDNSISVDAALTRLRGNSSVRFAEPIGKAHTSER
jgi:anti-sigma factor RsiW